MTAETAVAATLLGLAAWWAVRPAADAERLRRLPAGPTQPPVGQRAGPGARPLRAAAAWRSRWTAVALRRGAAQRERERALEACAALAGELRCGRPPPAALSTAATLALGPTGELLSTAASVSVVGGDVAAVLAGGADRSATPALVRGLSACWALCAGTGTGLAAAVERLEQAERDAEEIRRAVRAELAGPRATARMLAALPVAGLALATGLGADPLGFLLTTPLGLACLALGVALDGLGLVWTRGLLRRAAPGA